MKALALVLAVALVGACGASDEQPRPTPSTTSTTTDPTADLRAEVSRLEAELVKQAVDQQHLREQVRKLYVERASRSARRSPSPVVRVAGSDIWAALRQCESGGNYAANTGNGYYGAYQFSAATWRSMGTGYAYAHQAPPHVQDDAARRLQSRSGWGQWPACSRRLGLR